MDFIQRADYSSTDVEIPSFEAFLACYRELDVAAMDRQQQDLERTNADYCPWGIGVGMESNEGVHITRGDPGRFDVRHQRIVRVRFLGLIPYRRAEDEVDEGLSEERMLETVRSYFTARTAAKRDAHR